MYLSDRSRTFVQAVLPPRGRLTLGDPLQESGGANGMLTWWRTLILPPKIVQLVSDVDSHAKCLETIAR